jgi:hypothetical protein
MLMGSCKPRNREERWRVASVVLGLPIALLLTALALLAL